mmetsp:Transcript_42469/g.51515  ORF Transcript_42469/g.51515 Transcript_42469/m.51515 type:complete len:430 (-) Transcript_42469:457-1746(-)|eukprot:CAMPEP_0197853172 /NCGR_PEP_ID=MMETSP1438-20131217/22234_1 /TAXON_ID=1461541 /ORGANISM="Pterosperma sp., Strain CCMP1384" /LENGTH=429 /DNA_ID=CAMNT_0043467481 /DNA_START=87 /DNA_END=1376 /DNA_ORIENTATION=-
MSEEEKALEPAEADGAKASQAEEVRKLLEQMQAGNKGDASKRHTFWETQPVTQFNTKEEEEQSDGPIDRIMTPAEVKQEPYNLPTNFEWTTCDMDDEATVEEVYKLLNQNYVEDDDNMFRFDYSKEFLKWALTPPEYIKEWHIGVRVTSTKKLVAFITGIPAQIAVDGTTKSMAEINFLCVHKKLRSKRLAPVLIKEVTRRVNLTDIWQASYTAGIVLPKPVSTCRYWHRSLNPKKLIEVQFSRLHPRMTMSRTIKLYKLPTNPLTPGIRAMEAKDVTAVQKLLATKLDQYRLHPNLSEAEVSHWLLPRPNVIDSYVVENPETKEITDFVSFYTLPSTIIGNEHYNTLRAAYCYYYIAKSVTLKDLMYDALILAKKSDYDVFNALDVMENSEFLEDLKFGIGDGHLQYYLYNWRVGKAMTPQDIGLVLL